MIDLKKFNEPVRFETERTDILLLLIIMDGVSMNNVPNLVYYVYFTNRVMDRVLFTISNKILFITITIKYLFL